MWDIERSQGQATRMENWKMDTESRSYIAHKIFPCRHNYLQDEVFTRPTCSHVRGYNLKLRHHSSHVARGWMTLSVHMFR